jgi:hypothetical protein
MLYVLDYVIIQIDHGLKYLIFQNLSSELIEACQCATNALIYPQLLA